MIQKSNFWRSSEGVLSDHTMQIKNSLGYEIDVDCCVKRINDVNVKFPLLIFSHGFKGFKDWGGFPYMMNKFAEAGFFSVSFNFSFNGIERNNPMEFTRLDMFAKNTFSKELEDLNLVINYLYDNADKYNIDKSRTALVGHSRGGGISIIKANEDSRIKTLVTFASVSTFDRYSEDLKRKWKEKGYFEALNTRTNQMMRMDYTLIEDFEKNKSRFDIIKAAGNLKIPYLIIHGKEDLSVSCKEAEEIYNSSNKQYTELLIIENTGHTFGVVHPFQGTTIHFEKAIDKTISFLKNYLKINS